MALYHSPRIVTDGLVMCLDAANVKSYPGSGTTWYDLTGNGYNATISGTNTYTSTDLGKFDYRNSSQITNYVVMPHAAAQATSGVYTLFFWIQPQTNGTRFFHSMHNGSNDNYNIMMITTEISGYLGGSSIAFSNNEWLQIALVRNGSDSATMYKNDNAGVSSTQPDISFVANGGWILNQEQDTLGGGFVTAQNAYAAFSYISLYNRALTSEEIRQNFQALRGRYGI